MGIMNIPTHVEIDEMEELQMLEQAVIALAAEKLGWQDDLARARISVQMTQVKFLPIFGDFLIRASGVLIEIRFHGTRPTTYGLGPS